MRVMTLLGGAAALLAATSAPARATTSACRVEATQMVFGAYHGRTSAPQDITATITVVCNALGTSASLVSFSVTPGDGAVPNRTMRRSEESMRYQLFVDPARTVLWGNGTGGTQALTGSGTASRTVPLRASFTLYGRALARQRVLAGAYVDAVSISLQW